MNPVASAYYEALFEQAKTEGHPDAGAAACAADAFLDGRPKRRGGQRTPAEARHAAFWSAGFLAALPATAWRQPSLGLALVRYLAQDAFAHPALVRQLAGIAPDVLQRAVRHAGVVSRPGSPRWREIEALAASHPQEFGEFVAVLDIFRTARRERVVEVERLLAPLVQLTPLELLVYASLFAFEQLVPMQIGEDSAGQEWGGAVQTVWHAIEAIMAWKLATCELANLEPDDEAIGASLRMHLSPFLFPPAHGPLPRQDLYTAFVALLEAQVELDEFDARSADAFSYDDGIRFVRRGAVLEIEELDADAGQAWRLGEEKRLRLSRYWLHRALAWVEDHPEWVARMDQAQLERNLQALVRAARGWLQLHGVYGVDDRVQVGNDQHVDMFQALLAAGLMAEFFIDGFLCPFQSALRQGATPREALGRMAIEGFRQGENRLPLTWSERDAKIGRIQPWTASAKHPAGDPRAAAAILDFWTSDWIALAQRLRKGEPDLRPRLQERPVLKLGAHLFQLPWMMALQDNTVAAVNNLRRLGMRRAEARDETRRIEQRLGADFEARGFRVLVGQELPALEPDAAAVEEVDLLCASDGHLLLIELKSTFVRRSMKEAWLHRTTTLRKAGLQMRRKRSALCRALQMDDALRRALGLDVGDVAPGIVGWIVDTSLECDHERFDGFLKVSLEEVLVALRDERHWLEDPARPLDPERRSGNGMAGAARMQPYGSLYPGGFSTARFIAVVEAGEVWAVCD